MATINMPVRFTGSDAERTANRATHQFDTDEHRCWTCDCRAGSVHANYPCGQEAPRTVVTVADADVDTTVRVSLGVIA